MPRWTPAKERFWQRVATGDGCWEWQGSRSDTGYGCFYDGRAYSAHRYSWQLHFGPVPKGLCVLHRCDNRVCVRPDHLWVGTKAENSRDMAGKGRGIAPPTSGESHGAHLLTEAAVRDIRSSAATGRELARKYGVSESAVSLVRRGKAWRHLL